MVVVPLQSGEGGTASTRASVIITDNTMPPVRKQAQASKPDAIGRSMAFPATA